MPSPGVYDRVFETLVVSFGVVVGEVLADGVLQRVLAEEDHAIEALGFQGQEESLEMGVRLRRQLHPTAALLHDLFG
jgi:hypothetical protein